MKILHTIILAVIIPLLPQQASAQQKKDTNINFRVTRFDPADRPPPELSTKEGTHFKVEMHDISSPIKAKLRDGLYLDLYTSGSMNTKPAHSIKINASMSKDLLLILVPHKKDYMIIPVNAPITRIGGGSRLLINATSAPLGIKYGKSKPLVVQPFKQTILRTGSKDTMTPIIMSRKKGDKWKLVRSERWPNDRRFRSFVFIYNKPNSKRINVHAVPDRIATAQ